MLLKVTRTIASRGSGNTGCALSITEKRPGPTNVKALIISKRFSNGEKIHTQNYE